MNNREQQKNCPTIKTARKNHVDVSENSGTPKSSILIGVFHYKPSILGYPYFWKHPCGFPKVFQPRCEIFFRHQGAEFLPTLAKGPRIALHFGSGTCLGVLERTGDQTTGVWGVLVC